MLPTRLTEQNTDPASESLQ